MKYALINLSGDTVSKMSSLSATYVSTTSFFFFFFTLMTLNSTFFASLFSDLDVVVNLSGSYSTFTLFVRSSKRKKHKPATKKKNPQL